MALINCSECGNEVSNLAEVCPNCGNPIRQKRKKIALGKILAVIGNLIVTIAPFLSYVTIRLDLPGDPSVYSYNMWGILTPDAGSGESAGFWGLIPILIVVIGLIGMLLTILQIAKNREIKMIFRIIIPIAVFVLLLLFEFLGLKVFRETSGQLDEMFTTYSAGKLYSVKKAKGFYLLIFGALVSFVAPLIRVGGKPKEG